MAHNCYGFWGNEADQLTKHLDAVTHAQRTACLKRSPQVPPVERLYEGWIHRVIGADDYGALRDLYFDLCLALKQPTEIPNHFAKSTVGDPVKVIDAAAMGTLAEKIRSQLPIDGNDGVGKPGGPCHCEGATPRYGTPNWLEHPRTMGNTKILKSARALLRALRAAFGR